MSKKEKTLRDFSLPELLVELRQSVNAVHMYSAPDTVGKTASPRHDPEVGYRRSNTSLTTA